MWMKLISTETHRCTMQLDGVMVRGLAYSMVMGGGGGGEVWV